MPEPWLRGPLADVPPLVMPLFFSFAQVREDLSRHLEGITAEQTWRGMPGGSLGFHLQHLAGSVHRLTTYLAGAELTEEQLAALRREATGNSTPAELKAAIDAQLRSTENFLRGIRPETLLEPRTVGRQKLPTTVLGLLVHIAEHTQRHLGQAITLCHLLRAGR